MGKFLGNRQGQHAIEYAVVLIVVMAAIIIMGRYVIRAWNANMKGWEESAIDSLLDPMMPGPPVNLGPCSCSLEPSGCGPTGGCPADQRYSQCVCDPLGCGMGNPLAGCNNAGVLIPEGSGTCVCDISCCTPPSLVSCGPPNCPPQIMFGSYTCGCGAPQTGCFNDPRCSNDCIPPLNVPILNATPCPGYGVNLLADTNNILVPVCSGAIDGHCEWACDPPFNPINGNTACGFCLPGFVVQGTCGAGQCETPLGCAPGQCQS